MITENLEQSLPPGYALTWLYCDYGSQRLEIFIACLLRQISKSCPAPEAHLATTFEEYFVLKRRSGLAPSAHPARTDAVL
jgi:hypothetical protein